VLDETEEPEFPKRALGKDLVLESFFYFFNCDKVVFRVKFLVSCGYYYPIGTLSNYFIDLNSLRTVVNDFVFVIDLELGRENSCALKLALLITEFGIEVDNFLGNRVGFHLVDEQIKKNKE
jgi:hypothetical protein